MSALLLPKRFAPGFRQPFKKPASYTLDTSSRVAQEIGRGDVWVDVLPNAIIGVKNTRLPYAGTTKRTVTPFGDAIIGSQNASDGAEALASSTFYTDGWGKLSVVTMAYFDGSIPSSTEIELFRNTDTTGIGLSLSFYGNYLRALINTTGTAIWTASKDVAVNTTPGWYLFGMTWDGAQRSIYQVKLGGNASALRSDTCTGVIDVTDGAGDEYITIGGGRHTNAKGYDGAMVMTMVLEGYLTRQDMTALAKNPFNFLKPATPQLFFTAHGATTQTITASINAILKKQGVTATSSVDALLQSSISLTTDIDALLQKLGVTSTASIEALLQKEVSLSASIGALLKKTISTQSSIDAILSAGGIETASIDALLQKQGVTATATLNAILSKTLLLTGSIDALLQKALSTSAGLDGLLQKSVSSIASLDAILQAPGAGSVFASIDALLRKSIAISLSVDALLQRQGATTLTTIDALLRKRVTGAASLDAVLYAAANLVASLDSVIKRLGVSVSASVDAILASFSDSIYISIGRSVAIQPQSKTVVIQPQSKTVKIVR